MNRANLGEGGTLARAMAPAGALYLVGCALARHMANKPATDELMTGQAPVI